MRIIVTDNSDRNLVKMFSESIERVRSHRSFNNPDIITR